MRMAKVILTEAAQADVDGIPDPIYQRVLKIVDRLEHWPAVSGAKPLRHELAGHYRIRTGDYRVQFRVVGPTVIVEKIAHRDGFYEE
jgi:mRNA-degrading endonuclease RelE of RelBE toxin-antitoxin system